MSENKTEIPESGEQADLVLANLVSSRGITVAEARKVMAAAAAAKAVKNETGKKTEAAADKASADLKAGVKTPKDVL